MTLETEQMSSAETKQLPRNPTTAAAGGVAKPQPQLERGRGLVPTIEICFVLTTDVSSHNDSPTET